MCVSPGVDPVGGSGPPEQFAQVLSDTLPQDVAGALTLLTAAHHKLVEVGSAAVHRLHRDDGCSAVAGGEVGKQIQIHMSHIFNAPAPFFLNQFLTACVWTRMCSTTRSYLTGWKLVGKMLAGNWLLCKTPLLKITAFSWNQAPTVLSSTLRLLSQRQTWQQCLPLIFKLLLWFCHLCVWYFCSRY